MSSSSSPHLSSSSLPYTPEGAAPAKNSGHPINEEVVLVATNRNRKETETLQEEADFHQRSKREMDGLLQVLGLLQEEENRRHCEHEEYIRRWRRDAHFPFPPLFPPPMLHPAHPSERSGSFPGPLPSSFRENSTGSSSGFTSCTVSATGPASRQKELEAKELRRHESASLFTSFLFHDPRRS